MRFADDRGDLRNGGFGDSADHLRAVPDDSSPLDIGADHEAGHVGKEQKWNLEGVAQPDESRRLVGRVVEEHAALLHRLVREDPDSLPVEAGGAPEALLSGEALYVMTRDLPSYRLADRTS